MNSYLKYGALTLHSLNKILGYEKIYAQGVPEIPIVTSS